MVDNIRKVIVLSAKEAMNSKSPEYAMTRYIEESCIAVKSEDICSHKKAMLELYSVVKKKEKLVSFDFFVESVYKQIIKGSSDVFQDLMLLFTNIEIKKYRLICPVYSYFGLSSNDILEYGKYRFIPKEKMKEHLEEHHQNLYYSEFKLIYENKKRPCLCYFETECEAKDNTMAYEIFTSHYNRVCNSLKFIFCDSNISMKYGEFYDKQNIVDDFVYSCSDGIAAWHGVTDSEYLFEGFIDRDNRKYNVENNFFDKLIWAYDDDMGNYRVWELLNKPEHNEIEKRILRAIDWIGMAICENQPAIAFIQCAFAIECLLQDNNEFISKSITAQISEYTAFIIGRDKNHRRDIAKVFKELYKVRSKIAHGVIVDSLYEELQAIIWLSKQIVINFLLKPELRNITSMELLREFIEDKRYSLQDEQNRVKDLKDAIDTLGNRSKDALAKNNKYEYVILKKLIKSFEEELDIHTHTYP